MINKVVQDRNIVNDSLDKRFNSPVSDQEIDNMIEQIQSEIHLEKRSKELELQKDKELEDRLKALKGRIPTEQELQNRLNKLRERTQAPHVAPQLDRTESLEEFKEPLKTIRANNNLEPHLSKVQEAEYLKQAKDNLPKGVDISSKNNDVKNNMNFSNQQEHLSFAKKIKNLLTNLIVKTMKSVLGKTLTHRIINNIQSFFDIAENPNRAYKEHINQKEITAKNKNEFSAKKLQQSYTITAELVNTIKQNLQDLSKKSQDLVTQQRIRKLELIRKQQAGRRNFTKGIER